METRCPSSNPKNSRVRAQMYFVAILIILWLRKTFSPKMIASKKQVIYATGRTKNSVSSLIT